MVRNPRVVDARNNRTVPAAVYRKALADFLAALEIEDDTVFEVVVAPDRAVAKHVTYTRQDSGTMSGDFWTDVVTRDND